ncbi:MAG: hypothetical protein LBE81_02020 [Azonexus sp.]|jgi:hypothetical protein|uniref:hypothetical protein n=1 Tax=Azonexus sp. TaxID=1872668 RepID=UPI002832351C|nr:hypothetical protein [Azonexus sp.]MDR0775401.1 hypothetical protein [Azonexus sp.]
MKERILTIPLQARQKEHAQLLALQQAFAELCNALVPVVRQNRCWSRVGLHHLAYHALRARFPRMGSQMVCNAIYSVSRAYRMVYKRHKQAELPLPRLQFLPGAPVFFDRHTVSIQEGQLSMYTLDGRVRFGFHCPPEILDVFAHGKLREIALHRNGEAFSMSFQVQEKQGAEAAQETVGELPEYIVLLPDDAPEDTFLSDAAPKHLTEPLEA